MSDVRVTTTEPAIDGSTVVRSIQVFTAPGISGGSVDSVDGHTGVVVLGASDDYCLAKRMIRRFQRPFAASMAPTAPGLSRASRPGRSIRARP